MHQDFSAVILDDGGQVDLCPFVEGEVQMCVVVVLLKHGGHHCVVQDHVELREFC